MESDLRSVIIKTSRLWAEVGNSQESPGGTQKAHRSHPGDTQDAPKRHPGGSQEAPRRLPGGSQVNQGSKRPLREVRVILYLFLLPFLQKFYLFMILRGGFERAMILDAFLQA